ncbi:hypothetical protein FPOAC1_001780 [Fusarium poae]|uniref:hypothetical protein n=1 Tax=Fusarium poae TaxID=36050 RepID=UPI001CE9DAA9|nr:hypothetical protein FPOAC1_001780 [Fusarium poae]KAG8675787.1 hypothetical protein FPOAC1_001780 [Fusarium poae]
MPRLRGTKYLTCFYCGKRSNTKYDGITRQFLCLSCDATNYLDHNGEITDPPVATEREAPATLYANPRPSSPSLPQDSIFCTTCLKNQRLFTSSLAQYLPDDPNHPEYAELERNYYRYRKGLEERYPQWYSFQGLIVFFRFLFRRVLEMDGGHGQSRNAQLSAHLVMSVVMIMIYSSAKRSIKVDTTPLFGNSSDTAFSPKQPKLTRVKREEPKTFSDLLNEALDSPTLTPQTGRSQPSPSISSFSPRPYVPSSPLRPQESPFNRFNSLNVTPQRVQEVGGSDEMDWTPTESHIKPQSQYRAFQDSPALNRPRRAFGESPLNDQSPFWYKVPAAPTTPSHRLRNPPNAPIIRSKPVEQESIFFRGAARKRDESEKEEREVSFKPPSFFAPQESHDEASGLADLLSQSFSLGQEHSEPGQGSGARSSSAHGPGTVQFEKLGVEFMIVAVLLVLWGLTVAFPMPFGREVQLALLSATGIIALRVTGEAGQEPRDSRAPSAATYVSSGLSVFELAAVCWLGWETWKGNTEGGKYGVGVLTAMLGHQVWSSSI